MNIGGLLRAEMAVLEADASLLERAGRKSNADRIRRDISNIWRKHDRLEARRAAADARPAQMVSDLLAELERRVAV